MTMAFRAVAYQETLQNAGVSVEVARAHAKAMEEFVVGELVTRDYFRDHLDSKLVELSSKLVQVEDKFEGKLVSLEAKIDAKLSELELRIVRWVVGSVGAAAIGIIVTVLAALFRLVK